MSLFVEFHLIQNFAPSNLNRDDTGAPKDALCMATIKQQKQTLQSDDAVHLVSAGLPNPIAVFQRQGNDKTRTQGAQAGGFWRGGRHWRKVV